MNKHAYALCIAAALGLGGNAALAQSTLILGNLAGTGVLDTSKLFSVSKSVTPSLGFVTPSTGLYTLDSVSLALMGFEANDQALVTLRGGTQKAFVAGAAAVTAKVPSLDVLVTFQSASGKGGATDTSIYSFMPQQAYTLQPGAEYWLTVGVPAASTSQFGWVMSTAAASALDDAVVLSILRTPYSTNGFSTQAATQLSSYAGWGYSLYSSQAAAVPEPGSSALMVAGLGAVGLMARRRRGH